MSIKNLNPKIFLPDVEKKSMRFAFGEGLSKAALADRNIVALSSDLSDSVGLQIFRDKFPDRFIEVGVAEQNLASVASGMAAMGKIPFMSSYAVFSPGRNWEQIRTNICYNNTNVKIVSTHAGLNVGPDGGSHQMLEDIALARVLPRMTVISPCDAIETEKAVIAAARYQGPVYIRLPREISPVITAEKTHFEVGKANIVFDSGRAPSVAILATGTLLHQAIIAAEKMEKMGIYSRVINISTIKPLDGDAIFSAAKDAGAIVTVEEHQVAGGMGSAVAEFLAEHFPVPMEFVAVRDEFGQSGKAGELISLYRLDHKAIIGAVEKVMKRK